MTEFPYGHERGLPFPQASLKISSLETGKFYSGIWAKVDTGADRTVIPLKYLEKLSLLPIETLAFEGAHGNRFRLPIYNIYVTIEGHEPLPAEAAASENEDLILLGRDILNSYRLVLDGPNLRLAVSDR